MHILNYTHLNNNVKALHLAVLTIQHGNKAPILHILMDIIH